MESSLDTDWDMGTPPPLNQADFIARAGNASPSPPPPREGFAFTDLDDAQELPLQKLIRYWMNERHAPDILPIQAELLAGILDHIHKQSSTVNLLRTDPDASEDEHFRIMLAQTEIERVKFVVRSYVRTRLSKIEDYARWILSNPPLQERLSETELRHTQSYANLLTTHFEESVLKALPENQRSLDEQIQFMPSMITPPDTTKPVFALARRDCPPVYLPDGTKLEMRKGQISLTQYRAIESLLFQDHVELV